MGDDAHMRDAVVGMLMRHRNSLHAFVLAAVRDLDLAEDVLQDVSLAICSSWKSYDPSQPFLRWARAVARNRVRDIFRCRRRSRETSRVIEQKKHVDLVYAPGEANLPHLRTQPFRAGQARSEMQGIRVNTLGRRRNDNQRNHRKKHEISHGPMSFPGFEKPRTPGAVPWQKNAAAARPGSVIPCRRRQPVRIFWPRRRSRFATGAATRSNGGQRGRKSVLYLYEMRVVQERYRPDGPYASRLHLWQLRLTFGFQLSTRASRATRPSSSSRACSSTAATSRRTS